MLVIKDGKGFVRTKGDSTIVMLTGGPRGPQGPPGEGGDGTGGITRYYGEGPPNGVIVGASAGDEYVDTLTGDLYVLQ